MDPKIGPGARMKQVNLNQKDAHSQVMLSEMVAAVELVVVGANAFGQMLQKNVSKESMIANGHSILTKYIGGQWKICTANKVLHFLKINRTAKIIFLTSLNIIFEKFGGIITGYFPNLCWDSKHFFQKLCSVYFLPNKDLNNIHRLQRRKYRWTWKHNTK